MVPSVQSSPDAGPSRSTTPSIPRETVPRRSVTIAQGAVTATWLVGVALFLVPVGVGLWQVRRLRQVASPWIDGQALVQTLAPPLGVHRRIDALLHDAVTGRMTCGVLRPAIILPASAEQWDKAALRCALRHELEHVARSGLSDTLSVKDGLRSVLVPSVGLGRVATTAIGSRAGV